jgi:hypothetical protein
MPNYIVDPTRFYAEGAVVDWVALVRRLGIQTDVQNLRPTIELRWMLGADLGMPTEPFRVWTRVHTTQIEKPLTIQTMSLMFLLGYSTASWSDGSMSHVSVDVQAPAGGTLASFAGGPLVSNIGTLVTVPAGNTTVQVSAPVIDGLLVSPGVTVTAVRGIETGAFSQAAGWQLIEVVGLPVARADWGGVGRYGDPQGMVGAVVDARAAAEQRLTRGGPPIGWRPLLAAGVPAPPWSAPSFPALVVEVNQELLKLLRNIVASVPPNQQAAQTVTIPVPPPKNSSGDTMTAHSSDAQVAPLATTLMAASSDPFLSLVLGFGTAYPANADDAPGGVSRRDYMITAHWEKGLDGASPPADFAAIIPAPGPAPPPPPPANMVSERLGMLRPLLSDGNWRASTRISWDRTPDLQLFRIASFAVARAGITPPEPTAALMDKRPSGGFRPIGVNNPVQPPDPESWRLHAVDRELPIPSNPGARAVKYAAAIQDIYGQWTPWTSTDDSMTQLDLEQVRIVSAKLTPAVPGSGSVCPATLEIEFLWDWRVRRPQLIRFAGRLYAAAEHGSPPPSLIVPGGLDRSLGGGGAFLEVTFAGDTPSAPGATILGLNEGGDQNVPFGVAQGNEARRYRLSLPGFALDFGFSGHIGLALWAQGQERIAPQRTSAWSDNPAVVTASDPRPPVVPVDHVTLASLPDAAGQSHARLSWTPQPGATGYFVYESDETQILNAGGLHQPTPDQTLDDRVLVIKNAFNARPADLRRNFTRLNSSPLTGTSSDVALPKGSTVIHVYVVLGISAGQVESNWPGGPNAKDALIAVAAPHIMNPAAPMLEVQQYLDQAAMPPVFKARITITTRPGPRPKKIDLHRVRVEDAAKELDTMGPPIARIKTAGGGWTVTQAADTHYGSYIQRVQGADAPPGSWRRVWYRATAWTEQDDTRGGLPGRSPASTAAWVIIPPPDPPTISPLILGTGPAPPDVVVQWSSAAPLKRTPLGPHLLSVRAAVAGAAAGTKPLLSVDAPLDKLGNTQPATGSGVWIFGSGPGLVTYRALIRRAALTDPLRFIVRITDPIGRMGEALVNIDGGSVDPAPDLTDLLLHKVPAPPPPRVLLEFKSSVPLTAPLDGPYLLRVTVVRSGPRFPPHPPVTVEMPVGSIRVVPPPPGAVTLALYRLPGSGPKSTYIAVTSLAVAQFVVRITGPDGKFAQQTQTVS